MSSPTSAAEVLRTLGLGTADSGAATAPPRRPWPCSRCQGPATPPEPFCAPCRPTAIRERRRTLLGPAYDSIPERHRGAYFGAPELPVWVPSKRARADASRGSLAPRVLLVGRTGCGKSTLAAAILRDHLDAALEPVASPELWERAKGARWASAYDLARARAGHPLGQGEAPAVLEAMVAPVLVLDDLGAEPPAHGSAIADVVYARDARERITIVTSGFDLSDIASRYGEGIARRVGEGALIVRPDREEKTHHAQPIR